MSYSAESLDRGRVRRIVRLMLAHVVDGAISSQDVNNVFQMVDATLPERDAVLQALPEAGVQPIADAPIPLLEIGEVVQLGKVSTRDPVGPAAQTAPQQAADAARRLLRSDCRRRDPSKRTLTAEEEMGLAVLTRGPDIPLERELSDGYRGKLEPQDERARAFDAFMVHNMRLVWSIARTQDAGRLEVEDVVQHGMFGLRRAVEKFDATKGNKFSTYATWWIRQAITRGIANEGRLIRIPVHMFEQVNKVLAVRNRIFDEHGTCEFSRLVDEVDLPAGKVIECLRLAAGVVSLDKPVTEDGDSLGDFVLTLPADDADPAQLIDHMALRQLIRDALGDLTPREAFIISMRAGLDGGDPLTLDEIGKILGLTRERIRQIETKARGKLRAAFIDRGLKPFHPSISATASDAAAEDARVAVDSEEMST